MTRRDVLTDKCADDCAPEGWVLAPVPRRTRWVVRAVKWAALFTLASLVMGTSYSLFFVEPCEAQTPADSTISPDTSAMVISVFNYTDTPYNVYLYIKDRFWPLGSVDPMKPGVFVIPGRQFAPADTLFYVGWMPANAHRLETTDWYQRKAGWTKLFRVQLGTPPNKTEA